MNEGHEEQESIRSAVRRIETDLGLTPGFLENLRDENDWSFVIKVHAIFEAATGHLLCQVLNREELADVLSFLELSDKRRGKIAFVAALGLLEKADRRFISSLSELRNGLVHDVRNSTFSLGDHVGRMDAAALKQFAKNFNSFSKSLNDRVWLGEQQVTSEEAFRRDPKTALWWSAMVTLSLIYHAREIERAKADVARYAAVLATFSRWLQPAGE